MAPKKQDKIARYAWALPGDTGMYEIIPVSSLCIDHDYQRRIVSEKNTLDIARDFQWPAFGSLIVMKRSSGELFVVDGQQRLSAAKRRGDIDAVPCMVFASAGAKHEAQAFYSINTSRKPVSALDKFRSRLMQGAQPETEINRWLELMRMSVGSSGNSTTVDFVALLLTHWEYDAKSSRLAIMCQRKIIGQEPLHGRIHIGLWYLEHCGICMEEHIEKLASAGGRSAILRAIYTMSIETGKPQGAKICGLAILSILNHRRRNKILIPELIPFGKARATEAQ